jgi:glycosyltransferase involved in cell wall biosynthesis
MERPRVTVVIPTRARPQALTRCLEALERQTIAEALDVIVIQDGDDLPTLESSLAAFPAARLVTQRRAGPGAARNRGVALARAPIICFTDDDCEPDPQWAEAFEAALADGASAVVGRTVNGVRSARLANASQFVVDHLTDSSRESSVHAAYGAANNIAARADVYAAVQFDAGFRFAGGDRDWFARLHASGYQVAYSPTALVRHMHSLDLRSFLRQHFAYGRGAYNYRSRHGSPLRLEPSGFYTSLLMRAFRAGPSMGSVVALSQAATAAGYVTEALASQRRGPRN